MHLLMKASSLHIQNENTALLLASENGHLEVVKYLLANGANIGDKSKVRYINFIPLRILITLSTIYKQPTSSIQTSIYIYLIYHKILRNISFNHIMHTNVSTLRL